MDRPPSDAAAKPSERPDSAASAGPRALDLPGPARRIKVDPIRIPKPTREPARTAPSEPLPPPDPRERPAPREPSRPEREPAPA